MSIRCLGRSILIYADLWRVIKLVSSIIAKLKNRRAALLKELEELDKILGNPELSSIEKYINKLSQKKK